MRKVFQFCSGKGCCPVLVTHPDGSYAIEDKGQELVKMDRESAAALGALLTELTTETDEEAKGIHGS